MKSRRLASHYVCAGPNGTALAEAYWQVCSIDAYIYPGAGYISCRPVEKETQSHLWHYMLSMKSPQGGVHSRWTIYIG